MRTNYYYYSIIAVLVLFNFLFIRQNLKKREEVKPETNISFEENHKLKEILSVMVENQNVFLDGEQKIINENFDTLTFFKLKGFPKLCFFFNEYSCMPCVDKTIKILNRKVEEIGKDNMIILSYYNQPRNMYLFSHLNNVEYPLYNLVSKLNVSIATADIPFLFTVDSDLKVNNLLLVDQTLLDLVENYIAIVIENNFFTNKQ